MPLRAHRLSPRTSIASALLSVSVTAASITVAAIGITATQSLAAERPNIVVILADDLGFTDLGSYGSEINTPHLDALANAGLRFSNYHTAASCAPTRGMLLTGVDSHRNGVPNIVEAIPPEQAKYPHYRGALLPTVPTIAEVLRDSGYHTYMAGKWHLGHATPELRPNARGFERSVAMADSGADNWEKKPYLPIYDQANWYADDKETDLPDDFYSSKFLVDKTIEFIESNREDGKPFFSYLPFQAVHIPVQAPQEFTDKYLGVYDAGWAALRQGRFDAALHLGLVPKGTVLDDVSTTMDWEGLSADEKRYASKTMAVYAGMVDAMDFHVGRLVDYLKAKGEFDNTIFVFVSDNGSEGSDPTVIPGASLVVPLFLAIGGYETEYETLGTKGSFVTIGPSFASASASPLSYYKFFSREGGMRVPLIVSGPPVTRRGQISDEFVYVTDLAPTLLEFAGVTRAPTSAEPTSLEPVSPEQMRGKSLVQHLAGTSDEVHDESEAIGYELAGNAALFRGDFKVVKDRGPIGDDQWHLFNLKTDVGEANDLRDVEPEIFESMLAAYRDYEKTNNVLPVPDGYDQRQQVLQAGIIKRFKRSSAPWILAGLALALGTRWFFRRRRRLQG
jgi:arylsulfatase A-like enzyme